MTGILLGGAVYIVALGKWPAAIAICLLAIAAWRRVGSKSLLVGIAAIIAASWIDLNLPPTVPGAAFERTEWHLKLTSMPQQRPSGWDFRAEVIDGPGEGLRLLVHSSEPTLHPPTVGSRIYLLGEVVAQSPEDGAFRYLEGLNVSGEIYTSEIILEREGRGLRAWLNRKRLDIVHGIQVAIPGDAGALIAGFVTGDDGRLSGNADDEFRSAGLSHLTAVSGSNLAMLLTMVGVVGASGRFGRRSILIFGIALLFGYAAFVGFPPPTLRALILALFAASGRLVGRPVDLINLSLLTVIVQLAIDPMAAYSISFHLSTAASFGLAAGFSRYPALDDRHVTGDLLTATAFAQFATLPIIVGVFGTAPLLGLFANIAAIPFASFAFAVGVFGSLGLIVYEPLGAAMLIPAGWAAEVVLRIADMFGREWGRLEVGELRDAWIIGLTLVALILLLAVSGELRLIRRQLAAIGVIRRQNG
ncbi:MAG: ComEC/Rec2 family competence protein [Thermomicrobiales bacterium]|nr:ComEC/Rec2 family competence protein [Thermomicrobiales bacterium]